jgi:subtilisin family serine protease
MEGIMFVVRGLSGTSWRRKLVSAVAVTLVFVSAAGLAPPVRAEPQATGARVKNQVVATLRNNYRRDLPGLTRDYRLQLVEVLNSRHSVLVVASKTGESAVKLAARLNRDRRILDAAPRAPRVGGSPFGLPGWGTGFWDQLGLSELGFDESIGDLLLSIELEIEAPAQPRRLSDDGVRRAHDLTLGEGTRVAILDTGFSFTHPTLKFHVAPGATTYDFEADDSQPREEYPDGNAAPDASGSHIGGHGTFVAGLVHLAAPEAELMPLRVLDPQGNGEPALVALGIRFAADHGADVIVLGLASASPAPAVVAAIADVAADGVLVIASTGNAGSSSPTSPAASPCAIAVSGVGRGGIKPAFANYGTYVDISAPAVDVVGTMPDPDRPNEATYGIWSGTSFAAPFVAGQAALLKSLDPTLDPRELSAYIGQTAVDLDAVNPTYAGRLGAGIPHVTRSVYALADGEPPDLSQALIHASCVDG